MHTNPLSLSALESAKEKRGGKGLNKQHLLSHQINPNCLFFHFSWLCPVVPLQILHHSLTFPYTNQPKRERGRARGRGENRREKQQTLLNTKFLPLSLSPSSTSRKKWATISGNALSTKKNPPFFYSKILSNLHWCLQLQIAPLLLFSSLPPPETPHHSAGACATGATGAAGAPPSFEVLLRHLQEQLQLNLIQQRSNLILFNVRGGGGGDDDNGKDDAVEEVGRGELEQQKQQQQQQQQQKLEEDQRSIMLQIQWIQQQLAMVLLVVIYLGKATWIILCCDFFPDQIQEQNAASPSTAESPSSATTSSSDNNSNSRNSSNSIAPILLHLGRLQRGLLRPALLPASGLH